MATTPLPQDPFRRTDEDEDPGEHAHAAARRFKCATDSQPQLSLEAVLDATEGFIPLWAQGTVLRWRFNPETLAKFEYPDAVRKEVRQLMTAGVDAWGSAAPIGLDA
jgi:hypothetical protein